MIRALFVLFVVGLSSQMHAQNMRLPVLVASGTMKKVVSTAPEVGCDYVWFVRAADSLVYAEGRECDGRREGWWIFDQLEGSCARITGRYSMGERMGLWQCFDDEGNVVKSGEFVAGEASGFWRFFQDNGAVDSEGWCANGVKNGWWIEYFSDGLQYEGEYAGNQKIGVWKKYRDSRLVSVKDWGL